MPIANGIDTIVAYRKETTWGVLPGTGSGKQVRRVSAEFNLTKETYQSEEIREDMQIADFRHGIRSAEGRLSGELSNTTYADFIQSIVSRDFTLGASFTQQGSITSNVITFSDGFNPQASVLRTGDLVRFSSAPDAANVGINLLITDLSGTTIRFVRIPSGSLTNNAVTTNSYTFSVIGRKTYIPLTGHTADSYSIEKWYLGAPQSETYTGMKLNSMTVALPASGISTVEFGLIGANLGRAATTAYFVSPTVTNSRALLVASSCIVRICPFTAGALVAQSLFVTNFTMNVTKDLTESIALGNSGLIDLFEGRILVSGEFSVYYNETQTPRDYFENESLFSIQLLMQESATGTDNILSWAMPYCKMTSRTATDTGEGIVVTYGFQALLPPATGQEFERSTLIIQDTALT